MGSFSNILSRIRGLSRMKLVEYFIRLSMEFSICIKLVLFIETSSLKILSLIIGIRQKLLTLV